jgi:HEAT repeat protein
MSIDIPALIRALDTDDVRAQRRAGDQLIAAGSRALPGLIDALHSASPRVRKSAAFLLSAHNSAEVVSALGRVVVEDPEPKVRKNAAMSLGTLGSPRAVDTLAEALRRETVGWVRP